MGTPQVDKVLNSSSLPMDRDERHGSIPDRESFQDGVEIDLKIGKLAKTAETLTYSHNELLRCFSRVCTSAWNGGTENEANKENWTCIYPITLFRQAFPFQICLVFSSLDRKKTTWNPNCVFVTSWICICWIKQVLTILVALCHAFRIQSMAELIHRTAKKFFWAIPDQAAYSEHKDRSRIKLMEHSKQSVNELNHIINQDSWLSITSGENNRTCAAGSQCKLSA